MTLQEQADSFVAMLEPMMVAQGVSMFPFPARRHDEVGWYVGHVLSINGRPVTLTQQLSCVAIASDPVSIEDACRSLVERLVYFRPTVSAYLTGVRVFVRAMCCGLHLRFHSSGEGLFRVDVLVNQQESA